jgi:hypothetical protein
VFFIVHSALPRPKQCIYAARGKGGGVPNHGAWGQIKTIGDCVKAYPLESREDCHCLLSVTQTAVSQALRKAGRCAGNRNIRSNSRNWIVGYEKLLYPGSRVEVFRHDSSVFFQDFVYCTRCNSHSRLSQRYGEFSSSPASLCTQVQDQPDHIRSYPVGAAVWPTTPIL